MNLFRLFFFNLYYFRNPPWDTGISPPELLAFIATRPPGRALDMGCGSGTNAITLAKNGWQVTGIDFALRAIWMARKKAAREGVSIDFRVADVTRPPLSKIPFDLILDVGCFHSLPPKTRERYIRNIERLLAPQGTFLLYAFHKKPDEGGPGLVEPDLQTLMSCLRLVDRKDGSERGVRPSAWFTFQKLEIVAEGTSR